MQSGRWISKRGLVSAWLLAVTLLLVTLLLQACGGGGGNGSLGSADDDDSGNASKRFSGTITASSSSAVDSDINDPLAPYTSNDDFNSAQSLTNNTVLNGYVTAVATSVSGDRFASTADSMDTYRVNLTAGSVVSLRTADSSSGVLALYLYDINQDLVSLPSSEASNTETMNIASDGDYFIRVVADSGNSKYILSLSSISLAGIRITGRSANFIPGEAIVKYKNQRGIARHGASATVNDPHLRRWDLQASGRQIQSVGGVPGHFLEQSHPRNYRKLQTIALIDTLRADPDVEYAEPNYIRRPMLTPNDIAYSSQWHYPQINLPQAWDITTGSSSVVVAVVDTGVWLQHVDLVGQLVSGYDFITDLDTAGDGDGCDSSPNDPGDGEGTIPDSWHGTHVAGTVAARTNNGSGVAGVAYSSKVMPLRAIGRGGGSSFDIIQAMKYAAGLSNNCGVTLDNPVEVINLSLGGEGYSQAEQDVVTQIRNLGIFMVAAAGNEHTSTLSYPASYDGVISVSAVDANGTFVSRYSNYGSKIDIAAPGGDLDISGGGVLSTFVVEDGSNKSSAYAYFEGTSMSTPHVAGVLALMKTINPQLMPDDVDTLLAAGQLTNDKGASGRDDFYGYGLLDALKAVQAAQEAATPGSSKAALVATPSSLSFNSSDTAINFTLTRVGSSNLSVQSSSVDQDWMTLTTSSVDSNGLGTYILSVSRSGFGDGNSGLSDGNYSGTITFIDSDSGELSMAVSLQVGASSGAGDAGFVYVLLINTDTDDAVQQVEVSATAGEYSYEFTNVADGEYVIMAGSDVDNDLTICDTGETCGGYPTLSNMSVLSASGSQTGLDFVIGVTGTVSSQAGRLPPQLLDLSESERALRSVR